MNVDKIKEWLVDKPKWLKIVVVLVMCLLLGAGVWFGVSSCASVDIDKFNVNTDKVQVDVEGVKVEPKKVSADKDLLNIGLDYVYNLYGVESLWSMKYDDMDNVCIEVFGCSYSALLTYANSIGLSYDGYYFKEV